MRCPYPKSARLRTRRQFQRMAQSSVRHVGSWIIIECRPNNQSLTRLGITVTRRYGKAHQRNRFKRIIREAFRICRHKLKSGFDLNIKPRSIAYKARSSDIMDELTHLIGN